MRAIIIGGGIGGVTTAIALRRAGIEARVYERAPEPREVGAGIALWGNAVRALRSINAAEPVERAGERCIIAEILTSQGRVLKRTPVEALDRIAGAPMLLVHRAELLAALLSSLPPDAVRFGAECVGVRQTPESVTARFRDDSTDTADLLVGADGINSVVRTGLFGPQRHRYSGYTCWRGIAEIPESLVPPGYVGEIWGLGARFGITRIGRGRVYWWATANTAEGGRDTDTHATLADRFHRWAPPVPAVIDATPRGHAIRNDIIDRAPSRPWGRGRLVLVGDAAHPTSPNLGQGGCMAIEDGVLLPRALTRTRGVPEALRAFEHERFARCAMITNRSWTFGRWGQTERSALAWMRNTTMAMIPESMTLRAAAAMLKFE